MTMKRSIAVVYVFGLFLLGILIGALGMHLYHGVRSPGLHRSWGPGERQAGRGGFEFLSRALELTEEQEREIQSILQESRREARGMHEEMLPRVHTLMEQTHHRFIEVLTPEQEDRLDEILSRHPRSLEMIFLGHGPGDQRLRRGRPRGAKGPAGPPDDPPDGPAE
jgi:Spy/CpxP family protein refolding chaperone